MTCPTTTDDATQDYTPTRDDFERKLIQGIHDDAWEARITAFGIHGGERGYRLVPVDQAVNPDRGEPVTVFTASGLAEVERAAAEKALLGLASHIEETAKRTDNTFTEHVLARHGAVGMIHEYTAHQKTKGEHDD
ncbi:hypothetical protein [Leucobacter sp. G161]|uniref:hypothetical protein n=1 Tax=Leucobacter sp. G161 TaxID=663704 RepID=UPI00073D02B7|nr:hypothetical protein [Leucobacter sp. G161]KUF05685.1 hypothetical protein AUL38_15945 [Leucobacter sp. G161]